MIFRVVRGLSLALLILALTVPAAEARIRDDGDPTPVNPCAPGQFSKTGNQPCTDLAEPAVFPPPGTTGADFGCWTVVVSNSAGAVDVLAVGAAGESTTNGTGGLGDGISATAFGLVDGDRLRVCVNSNSGPGGLSTSAALDGGAGGGASGVSLAKNFSFPFVIAGGGGGASHNYDGGDAGMPKAEDGANNPSGADPGTGGSNSVAFAPGGQGFDGAGNGSNGASFTAGAPALGGEGGDGTTAGGGGGAGYRSGGGGGGDNSGVNVAAGGGGGSSFCGDAHNVGEIVVANCVRTAGAGTKTTWGSGDGFAKVVLTFHEAEMCTAGSYSANGFDYPDLCTQASVGHFVDAAGATEQTECALGTYQPLAGQTSCLAADIGSYVDTTGSNQQTACPTGQTTVATGSDSIADCFTAGADMTPPTMSTVVAGLAPAGQIGSVPILLEFSASDDVTAADDLIYEVQVRRWKNGAWTNWGGTFQTDDVAAETKLPIWRKFQYRARARDAANNWSDWMLSSTILPIRRQERHFTLSGGWTRISQPGAMKGKVARSEIPGSTARLRFDGNGVALVMPADPGQGTINVCIDPGKAGEECRTIDVDDFRPLGNKMFVAVFDGLASGRHVLRVTVVSGTVDLDGAVFTK